jgi:hypothetical protein
MSLTDFLAFLTFFALHFRIQKEALLKVKNLFRLSKIRSFLYL